MQEDDNHLPAIDTHPTEIPSQWTQLSSKVNITSNHAQATNILNAIYHSVLRACLKNRELLKTSENEAWLNSLASELGRLSQGYKLKKSREQTPYILHHRQNYLNKKPACAITCCNWRPLKTEQHRTQITVGGWRLQCFGETETPIAIIATTKMHLNITIST